MAEMASTEASGATTVGIPVYNEARLLANTLKSVDGQADQIIICDNASTDGTEEICREFAASRANVRYVRMKSNRGAGASFRRCVDLAETEYFMWLGGHDLLVPNYVSGLKQALDTTPDVLLAFPNALHLDTGYRYLRFYYYTWSGYLMNERPEVRVAAIVQLLLDDCTMYHGLYRKKALDAFFEACNRIVPVKNFYLDHVVLAYIASLGKMKLYPFCNYIRLDPRESQSKEDAWKRVVKACDPTLPPDPKIVPLTVFKGQKTIMDELAARPETDASVLKTAYETLMYIWGTRIA